MISDADQQIGDKLRAPDGRWVIVDNVLCTKRKQEVFNLEVKDAHTYFVALPRSGKAVWVHNESGWNPLRWGWVQSIANGAYDVRDKPLPWRRWAPRTWSPWARRGGKMWSP